MADAPHVAPLISFLLTLFFVNVLLKSSRDDIIYQRPSFANGLIVLAATFPRISHRKFVIYGKSMLRHRYYTRKYLFILFLLISNDIQLNPGPLNSSTLKSCSLNARSIVNKRTELQAMVATKELDIIAITETWLNPEIMDQEILSSDYNIYRRDRLGKGGGVLLALRDNICCYRRCDLETDCEILWCEVHFNPCSTYFIGVYYRSPSSDMAYLPKLVQSLEKFSPSCNILFLGNFNLPNVNWNLVAPWQPDIISDFFCDSVINCFGLSQPVNKPTRGDALLDLI